MSVSLKRNIKICVVCSLTLIISACNNKGFTPMGTADTLMKNGVKQNQKIANEKPKPIKLPQSVSQLLLPKLSINNKAKKRVERRFNVSAQSVPATDFFNSLVQGTDYNIVVSPDIKGNISLHLKNVTIDQVLAATEQVYGYRFQKETYGYRIFPRGLETRIFSINYLGFTRTSDSFVSVRSGLVSQQQSSTTTSTGSTTTGSESVSTPSSSVKTESKSDFWKELGMSLETIIGKEEGHKVYINPVAGMVVLRGTPEQLDKAKMYMINLNKVMSREVLIQAEIVKVRLNKNYDAGIEWSLLGGSFSPNGVISNTAGDVTSTFINSINPILSISTQTGKLSAVMKFLSTQGNVQVLSSPRITSMNNQKAIIKVGADEYFVTDFSSTVSGSGQDAQATQDVDLNPFFSGISLGVTPMITNDDGVMMHIHPIISEVKDLTKNITIGGNADSIPSAFSEIDESDNVVYARSGQIIIVSGLRQNTAAERLGSVPGVGKIPVVGALFRRTNQAAEHEELVILLKPTIVGNHLWVKELHTTTNEFKKVTEGFHVGNFPDTFGNTGG